MPTAEVVAFTELLADAMTKMKTEHSLSGGLRMIGLDINTIPIDTDSGKKQLTVFYEYNNKVPFYLFTNDRLLPTEITNLGIQIVQY